MMNCGVYSITNLVNGHAYIGSSVNIEKRWCEHTRHLNKNEHHSIYLQRAWNKYGEQAFEFATILLCDEYMTLYCEQELLQQLKPAYNIALDASAPMKGLHHTEEARALMSLARMGNTNTLGNTLTEEHKQKLRAAGLGELNHNWGKPMSEEQKLKISLAAKGRHHTLEACERMSEAHKGKQKGALNPMFGKHHSEATIALISAGGKGKRKSAATCALMSEAQKGNTKALGSKRTEEQSRNSSEAQKLAWAKRKAQMQPVLETV